MNDHQDGEIVRRAAFPAGERVGYAELAQVLGVSKSALRELYLQRPGFPRPSERLGLGPLWYRSQVEAWRGRHRAPTRPPPKPTAPKAPLNVPPACVGFSELPDLLGVSTTTAANYMRRADFPPPLQTLASGRLWRRSSLEHWRDHNLPLPVGRLARTEPAPHRT